MEELKNLPKNRLKKHITKTKNLFKNQQSRNLLFSIIYTCVKPAAHTFLITTFLFFYEIVTSNSCADVKYNYTLTLTIFFIYPLASLTFYILSNAKGNTGYKKIDLFVHVIFSIIFCLTIFLMNINQISNHSETIDNVLYKLQECFLFNANHMTYINWLIVLSLLLYSICAINDLSRKIYKLCNIAHQKDNQ